MQSKFCTLGIICLFLMGLSACTKEQNYRGVPDRLWQHLSGEQRQLIVDQAYQDEMQKNKGVGGKP